MTALRCFRVGIVLLATLITGYLALAQDGSRPIQPPPDLDGVDFIYHGVNVGNVDAAANSGGAAKNDGTPGATTKPLQTEIDAYLKATKRTSIAWVNFAQVISKEDDAIFPADKCKSVAGYNAVPFINLVTPGPGVMLEGSNANGWTLKKEWTDAINKWGQGAGAYIKGAGANQKALIIAWGAGCNSDSSCWKMKGDPERFKTTYAAIQSAINAAVDKAAADKDKAVDKEKKENPKLSDNITWVFQIQVSATPDSSPRFEDFYPSPNAKVDWIGASIFGASTTSKEKDKTTPTPAPDDPSSGASAIDKKPTLTPLAVQFGPYYHRIREMDSVKPIIIAAFGCPDTLDSGSMCWARDALQALASEPRRFPKVIGFAWFDSSSPFDYCAGAPQSSKGESLDLGMDVNSVVAGVFPRFLADPKVFSWPSFKKWVKPKIQD